MGYIKQLLVVFFCSFLFLTAINAGDTIPDLRAKNYQIGISDVHLVQELMATMPGIGSNARDMLNQQSVKAYMMPPRKKGIRGSANCYAMASCLEFYANYGKNYKVNLSPDFIALNLSRDNMEDALRFLTQKGTVSAAIMPFESTSISSAVRATFKYSIQNYLHIFRKDTRNQQKIFDTKRALMRGNPIIVQLSVPGDFGELRNLRYWEGNASSGGILQPFVVVSYNEEQEMFELLSSYGENWADGGYVWVKYQDYARMAENGYVLVPQPAYEDFGR
jgi:hypothetical protein